MINRFYSCLDSLLTKPPDISGGYSNSCFGCNTYNPINIHCPANRRGLPDADTEAEIESRDSRLTKRLDTAHYRFGCYCYTRSGSNQASDIALGKHL